MSRIRSAIVLSDLHLGWETSYLYSKDERFKRNSQALETLLLELGSQDEVILLGDFLELAIGSLDEVYQDARKFFSILSETGPYERIVFIPGNHDHHFWRELAEEIFINESLRRGSQPPGHHNYPRCFVDKRFSVSGSNPTSPIVLSEVWPHHKPMPEIVVKYPHHLVRISSDDEKDKSYLLTHGHFLEDLYKPVNYIIQPAHLEELEAFNNFWLESFDYHIGHAGRLSTFVRKFIQSFQRWGAIDNPEMENMIDEIFRQLREKDYLSWLSARVLKCFFKGKLRKISWNENSGLYKAAVDEKLIRSIEDYIGQYIVPRYQKGRAKEFGLPMDSDIPMPFTFVFGHTHIPIKDEDMEKSRAIVDGKVYPLLNTGGWLRTDGPGIEGGENAGVLAINKTGASWRSLSGHLE
ncbi:MAG: metallophosphoesterase [Candidatus Aminicenantaceae bacterium]